MEQGEMPWRRAYWLGDIDGRPLALFRIAFGVVMLQDLAMRVPDLGVFLSDDGMLPRGVQSERWAWGLFDLVGGQLGVALLFGAGVIATALFTLGYRTRWMTLLTWLFTLSLQNRNLSIGDGGDDLTRVLLFWALFTDLGAVWSLDARSAERATRRAPALGARLLQLHVALVYLGAGYYKLRGGWLQGDVVYQSLQLTGFLRPPGEWLLAYPTLCRGLTYGTLVVELVLPVLLVSPFFIGPSRALAIFLHVGLQLGLLVTMRVGIFSGVMLCSALLYLQPRWLDAIEARWHKRRGMPPPEEIAFAPAGWPSASRFVLPIAVASVAQFALTALVVVITPAWADTEIKWVGLNQGLDLFSKPIDQRRWRAPGVFDDGSTSDILPQVIPELRPDVGYIFTRWTKFTFKRSPHFDALGRYLCRRHAEQRGTGPALRSFTLVRDIHAPSLPGQPTPPLRTEVLWEQHCAP